MKDEEAESQMLAVSKLDYKALLYVGTPGAHCSFAFVKRFRYMSGAYCMLQVRGV